MQMHFWIWILVWNTKIYRRTKKRLCLQHRSSYDLSYFSAAPQREIQVKTLVPFLTGLILISGLVMTLLLANNTYCVDQVKT